MTTRRWVSLATLLAMVLAACSADTAATTTAGGTATSGGGGDTTATSGVVDTGAGDYCAGGSEGPLVWAHEQEPPDLHLNDPNNGLSITSYLWQAMWEDLYGVTEDLQF